MLVLSRRPGEEIILDGTIRITVVSVKGNRIRIGIEAPRSVVVDRKEIHERRPKDPNPVATAPCCCAMGSAKGETAEKRPIPVLR
jgi:carbon storage regulator